MHAAHALCDDPLTHAPTLDEHAETVFIIGMHIVGSAYNTFLMHMMGYYQV